MQDFNYHTHTYRCGHASGSDEDGSWKKYHIHGRVGTGTSASADYLEGFDRDNPSLIRETNYAEVEINQQNITEFQRRTLQVCKGLKNEGKTVILVTNNMGLQIKAHMEGINAEEFKDEIFPVIEEQYTGRINIEITPEIFNIMYQNHEILISDLLEYKNVEFLENCFVVMTCGSKSFICKVKGDKIVEVNKHDQEPYDIKPMNIGQKLLMNALYDETPLVIVKGPPGTGKTLLSMAVALDRVVENKEFSRILITRSVSNDKLGYLPGNVNEKLSPFLQGVTDNLDILINGTKSKKLKKLASNGDNVSKNDKNKLEKNKSKYATDENEGYGNDKASDVLEHGEYFFERGIIKIQALEMIRGRSITNTIFIIDETQNIEPEFAKTIVSRAAKGSKFIFLGDPSQVDNPKLSERYNALVYLAEKLKGDPDCTVVSLEEEESVRSRLAIIATQIL